MALFEYLFGKKGEELACEFLKTQGFEILKRNFYSKFGEIDIIAKKDKILHFIEVKSTQGDYEVEYRLDNKKYNKIIKTIEYYFMKHKNDENYQLDLLCVYKDDVKLLENISY
ncbi:YraN family protein [Campylobacter lari]|uniref:YraN family protein n=1 Tax=Campylobacter sp. CNRCH_2007_0968H TaxID=2911598 RepID=UPI00126C473F|nr:YraN family protein [Campylobacter sp. CNRCH_2007_0968H]EAJ5677523.1 YraN family protein [Campylobacter lari]EAK0444369.1 YraN family protein [Campylobacter lari]EAK9943071.1 YraN family protein [Campylobacter lari]MCV3530498.1 YraN family protein [Campylobacter sp. CNRCH_2007_0968H]